ELGHRKSRVATLDFVLILGKNRPELKIVIFAERGGRMPHELDWFFLYGALSHIHLMTASIPPWVGVPLGIIAMALAFATAFYVGYNWISLLTRRAERSFALGYARMTVALALATVPVVANFPLFLFW